MRSEDARELNALLDAGLSTYCSVEPRVGMEERVLRAALAEQTPRKVWWPWAAALASACVLAVVISTLVNANTVHAPSIVQSSPAEHAAPRPKIATPETPVGPRLAVAGTAKRGGGRETAGRQAMALANHGSTNTDEMFPSPQVLSEEESTIIAMIEQHPAEISQALIEAQRRSAEPVRVAAIHIEPLNNGGQQ